MRNIRFNKDSTETKHAGLVVEINKQSFKDLPESIRLKKINLLQQYILIIAIAEQKKIARNAATWENKKEAKLKRKLASDYY